jgi:hypothetical protein
MRREGVPAVAPDLIRVQFEDVQAAHGLFSSDRVETQSLYYYRPWMCVPTFTCPLRVHFFCCAAASRWQRRGHLIDPPVWRRQHQNEGYINYTRIAWSDHSYSCKSPTAIVLFDFLPRVTIEPGAGGLLR